MTPWDQNGPSAGVSMASQNEPESPQKSAGDRHHLGPIEHKNAENSDIGPHCGDVGLDRTAEFPSASATAPKSLPMTPWDPKNGQQDEDLTQNYHFLAHSETPGQRTLIRTDAEDGNLRYDLHTTGPNGTSAGVTVASTKSSGFSELRQTPSFRPSWNYKNSVSYRISLSHSELWQYRLFSTLSMEKRAILMIRALKIAFLELAATSTDSNSAESKVAVFPYHTAEYCSPRRHFAKITPLN